jgi:hypothetical protein
MRRRASLILLLLIGIAGAEAVAGKKKVYRLAGAGEDDKGKPAPTEVLSATHSGVHLSIRYLDAARAGEAMASVVPGTEGLFRERTDAQRGHLVFALQIENGGGTDLIYEPGQGRLITDRSDAEFPLDYTGLYELLRTLPEGAPALEEIEAAVYSRSVTVRAGGSIRKLLVFEGPRDGNFKKIEVRIGVIHTPEGDIDARFPFRRFEVES